MRCLKKQSTLKSREGNEILTMDHIASELNHIKDIFDGELYAHGDDFQTNMEYVKKYRKGESEKIKYHVYDMVLTDQPFSTRHALLSAIIHEFKSDNIILVPTYKITSKEELDFYNETFISEGYEGSMIRISKDGYKTNSRSNKLLKVKIFKDLALEVLDIVPCKNKTDWGEVIYKWPGAKGHRCGIDILGSNSKMSHKVKKEILLNKEKYVGKIAEVRFFEYSNTGVPRFPVTHGFRIDKTKQDGKS